jgi:hypothetical protein
MSDTDGVVADNPAAERYRAEWRATWRETMAGEKIVGVLGYASEDAFVTAMLERDGAVYVPREDGTLDDQIRSACAESAAKPDPTLPAEENAAADVAFGEKIDRITANATPTIVVYDGNPVAAGTYTLDRSATARRRRAVWRFTPPVGSTVTNATTIHAPVAARSERPREHRSGQPRSSRGSPDDPSEPGDEPADRSPHSASGVDELAGLFVAASDALGHVIGALTCIEVGAIDDAAGCARQAEMAVEHVRDQLGLILGESRRAA